MGRLLHLGTRDSGFEPPNQKKCQVNFLQTNLYTHATNHTTHVEFDVEEEEQIDAVDVFVRPQRHLELEAETVQLAVSVPVGFRTLRRGDENSLKIV